MAGGNVTVRNAGTELGNFLTTHSKSFHVYPASQVYAKLCLAIDRFDLAKEKLAAATKSGWPAQELLGHIELGKIALIEKDYAKALEFFKAAGEVDSSDEATVSLKQIASCRQAQAEAMTGDPAKSIADIKAIIEKENNDDKMLFSNAYNALAHCHLKAGDKKSALLAFLHTQLLFTGQPDTHSEALFHLTQLWNDLNYPDRAAEAQRSLRSSYRNTYYGSKS